MNQNTTLLVMDMQEAILKNYPGAQQLKENVARAIRIARGKAIPVIYVMVYFRQGAPEISKNNKGFAPRKETMTPENLPAWQTIVAEVAPMENDIIVVKRRVSAFTGSDLEVVLRSLEAGHIMLTGYATSGVILSTTREAADKDYRITILSDACADMDEEVHRVLTTKIFPRQADVMQVDEWK